MRLRGATAPSDQRCLIISAASTIARKPIPAMKPACRFGPEQEEWRQQPDAPPAGAQVRLRDPECPADEREREDLRPGPERRARRPALRARARRRARPARRRASGLAAPWRACRSRRRCPSARVTSARPPTAASAAKIASESHSCGDERIPERRVGEQLAGRDLVVGDDPVAEPDVPPDVGVAERIEPDRRQRGSGRRRAALVEDPQSHADTRLERVGD